MAVEIPAALLRDRIQGGLFGLFAGDALAMPVHWFYNTDDIDRFARAAGEPSGRITRFHAPPKVHPSSIMPYASTVAGGRGSQSGHLVGDVILHGKRHRWGVPNVHYHEGMKAGENTLNLQVTRLLIRGMTESKQYSTARFLQDYVKFMTTPGTHNDTYAESYHRDFFKNYAQGIPPEKCCGAEGHDTPSIGGLVMLPAVVFANHRDRSTATQQALAHMALTHESQDLRRSAKVYVELMWDVIHQPVGADIRPLIEQAATNLNFDIKRVAQDPRAKDDRWVVGRVFSPACYISGSLPAILFLAYKYHDNIALALEANTAVGGDNCHRGATLGALLGASIGLSKLPAHYVDGLVAREEIRKETDQFLDAFVPK